MDLGIRKRTALVLGGGGGLGSAIARTLAAEGTQVAVGDIDASAAGRTADTIRAHCGKSLALGWDIADLSVVDARVSEIERLLGVVDILVNITGGPPPTPAAGQEIALWERSVRTMIMPVIAITDRVLPGMKDRGWGRIITSTSSGVIVPIANLGISNALRSSLLGWSKTLANEVARHGVTCNVVVPGRIATGRIQSLDEARAKREGRSVEEVSRASQASIPIGRYGRPEEYADVVAFLASERASYVTGAVIRVDGGLVGSI